DEPISKLKEAIKAKKAPRFDDIPADELKLWKVKIPDDRDSELVNPALDVELLATRDVGDYWTKKLPKRHIYVIVEPPVSTTTSSRKLPELRE
ncbi:3556_t:CDS:1, partial [Paraglomus occultum]